MRPECRSGSFDYLLTHKGDKWNSGEGNNRQLPVYYHHHHRHSNDRESARDNLRDAGGHRLVDCVYVIGDTAHGIAMTSGVMELERKQLDPGEELTPEVLDEVLAQADHAPLLDKRQPADQGVESNQADQVAKQEW